MQVPRAVLGRELGAFTLADLALLVFRVLEVPELGRRRELLVVGVGDAGLGERPLQALRIGPGVLAPANTSPLAHVDEQLDAGIGERVEEALERPAVDADV